MPMSITITVRAALRAVCNRVAPPLSRAVLRQRRLVAAYPAYFVLSNERADRQTQKHLWKHSRSARNGDAYA